MINSGLHNCKHEILLSARFQSLLLHGVIQAKVEVTDFGIVSLGDQSLTLKKDIYDENK